MDFLTRAPNGDNESDSGKDETHSGHVRAVKRRVIESSSESEGEEEEEDSNKEAEAEDKDEFEEGEPAMTVSCKFQVLNLHENHSPTLSSASREGESSAPVSTLSSNQNQSLHDASNHIELHELEASKSNVWNVMLQINLPVPGNDYSPSTLTQHIAEPTGITEDVRQVVVVNVQPPPITESRYGRKRKAVSRSYECECGEEITPKETEKGEVISCKERGCETIWVSMNLTFNLFRKLIIM